MTIRNLIKAGLAGAAMTAIALSPATAQDGGWEPERPIQIVVGFAPGGGTDQTARLIASAAQEFFPVPLVVVNRPGASGTLAAELVANAAPDGYTLLVAGGSESTSVPNHRETNYSLDQFKPVLRVNRSPTARPARAASCIPPSWCSPTRPTSTSSTFPTRAGPRRLPRFSAATST